MKNEVKGWIPSGLEKWSKIATVHLLGKLQVPQIVTRPRPPSILVLTGHHLEETSGPYFALEPDNFQPWMNAFSFVVFPVINQYGLNFPSDSDENLLRKNKWGINYNSGWGGGIKAEEVKTIEAEISNLNRRGRWDFDAAISLHEDSTNPREGSFYINGLNHNQADEFVDIVYSDHGFPLSSKAVLVDEIDKFGEGQSSENWLASRGIGTFLIEAPFGLPMKERIAFVNYFFSAILSMVGKVRW